MLQNISYTAVFQVNNKIQGMVASSEIGLQRLMDRLNAIAKKYSMRINIKKTKTMVVSKKDGRTVSIMIDGQKVEQVKTFKYLVSVISEDGRCMDEINQRIACAKDAFNKRKELLSKSMNKPLKKRIVKALVWPVAYGCETWVMKKEAMDRLEAFEMWVLEKIGESELGRQNE